MDGLEQRLKRTLPQRERHPGPHTSNQYFTGWCKSNQTKADKGDPLAKQQKSRSRDNDRVKRDVAINFSERKREARVIRIVFTMQILTMDFSDWDERTRERKQTTPDDSGLRREYDKAPPRRAVLQCLICSNTRDRVSPLIWLIGLKSFCVHTGEQRAFSCRDGSIQPA